MPDIAKMPGVRSYGVKLPQLSTNVAMMEVLCRAHGVSLPTPEFRFHPTRRWRLDFAWQAEKVALEVQGGLFIQGRHSRGAALLKEHEKLNMAAIMGWRVLYCTPKDIQTGAIFPKIKVALLRGPA